MKRKVADLLEEVMLTSEAPTLRVLAAELFRELV